FDASAEEIFGPLTAGAVLVQHGERPAESGAAFFEACGALGATVLDLSTSYWHELCNGFGTGELQIPPSVKGLIFGGERAAPDLARRWVEVAGPAVKTVNAYGPTEATIAATACELTTA